MLLTNGIVFTKDFPTKMVIFLEHRVKNVKNLVLDPSISLDLGVVSLLTMTSTLSSRENIFMKSNLQSAI